MSNIYIITSRGISGAIHGVHAGYEIRQLLQKERVAIEDKLFAEGKSESINVESSAIIVPNIPSGLSDLHEYAILAEFALALITVSGNLEFDIVAVFNRDSCEKVLLLPAYTSNYSTPQFVKTINGAAAVQWVHKCVSARANLKERMHITADRYVRYNRSKIIADALLDLCICLESLIDSQTEVSFRFGICLSKVIGGKGKDAEQDANLLSELYDLRSKIAHGDPASIKLLKKIDPKLLILKQLAKRILTSYILFMSENSRDKWKSHLRSSLFR